jgi:hypothetical protein
MHCQQNGNGSRRAIAGEHFPKSRGVREPRVERAMKPMEWKTYRTRFLVKAKQLNSNFSFVDALGRQHSGRKGDYLVESSDGVVSITPRRIFEDIYVPMMTDEYLPETCIESVSRPPRKAAQPCRAQRTAGTSLAMLS